MHCLLFFLLFAPFGVRALAPLGDIDCEDDRCFVLLKCHGGLMVVSDVGDKSCSRELMVNIDTRTARRFDFRVFYVNNETELNLPDIVIMNGKAATLTLDKATGPRNLNLTFEGPVRTTGWLSYRFRIEVEPPANLFDIFRMNKYCKFKLSGWKKGTYYDCWSIYDSFVYDSTKHGRCDTADLLDYCNDEEVANGKNCSKLEISETAATCSDRLWQYNTADDSWLHVHGIECSEGTWQIKRDGATHLNVKANSGMRLLCGEHERVSQYLCDEDNGFYLGAMQRKTMDPRVLWTVLGLYCFVMTIALVVLFMILYRKATHRKGGGPSKYNIMSKSILARLPSSSSKGSSSGSSSSSDNAKAVRTAPKKTMKEKKEKKQSGKDQAASKPAKKAKKSFFTKKQPGKKVKESNKSSNSASKTDVKTD